MGNWCGKTGSGSSNQSLPQRIRVDQSLYKVDKLLGEGGYGKVFLTHLKNTDGTQSPTLDKQYFAIKQMSFPAFNAHDVDKDVEEQYQRAIAECVLMQSLPPHPNIPKYISHQSITTGTERIVYLVMEYCPNTLVAEMNEHLQKGTRFSEGQVWAIFRDIVAAVVHFHSQSPPVTHRDVKVENVLKTTDGRYVLCDAGSATTTAFAPSSGQEIRTLEEDIFPRVFTIQYQAPEALDLWSKQRVDTKIDVWALGVVLYYIVFLKAPFDGCQKLQIINARIEPPPQSAPATPSQWEMVKYLLNTNAASRPTVFDVAKRLSEVAPSLEPIHPLFPPSGQLPQPLWTLGGKA